MADTKVSIIKLKGEGFKLDEISCTPGHSVEVFGDNSVEIMFSMFDKKKVILIDDVYFDHINKSLKSPLGKPITQKFRITVKELALVIL
jgi:hypothetical protein